MLTTRQGDVREQKRKQGKKDTKQDELRLRERKNRRQNDFLRQNLSCKDSTA